MTALEQVPVCPVHGTMELRDPPGGWTPEQQFCGIWYDCWHPGCYASCLFPSPQLSRQLAEQRSRSGADRRTKRNRSRATQRRQAIREQV